MVLFYLQTQLNRYVKQESRTETLSIRSPRIQLAVVNCATEPKIEKGPRLDTEFEAEVAVELARVATVVDGEARSRINQQIKVERSVRN